MASKFKLAVAVFGLALVDLVHPVATYADVIEAVPTNWRLQNYVNDQIVIYYTGSPCPQGILNMPGSASLEDKARLVAIILTAKATGRPVGIFYDPAACVITSFYAT